MERITSFKLLNAALWCAQILLAVSLLWSSYLKLWQPLEQITGMWPWTGQVPVAFLRFTGIVDLCAATGLILPSALRIRPKLTAVTALSLVVLMLCAIVFHVARGEASSIGVNILFAAIAVFIAWGRFKKMVALRD